MLLALRAAPAYPSDLSEALVGDTDHRRLGHCGVLAEGRFDLRRVRVEPAADEHVLGAVSDLQVAGLVRGAPHLPNGITVVAGTLDGATLALLERLVVPGREIVTVVEGADATAGNTDVIRAWLEEHHPDVQVEVHRGGQPLYPYLFGVE